MSCNSKKSPGMEQKCTEVSTEWSAVADPGFPRGGGANSQGGAPTYDFVNFRRKLHENEEILAARGARVPCAPP